jgi:Tfp pilus assembly protein PilF
VRAARAAHPDDPFWDLSLASISLILGDTALTDSLLPRVLARGEDPRALLIAGNIATQRNQPARARVLLARALAAGGDTSRARATLAVLAARDSLWPQVVADVRASLRATRNNLRSPFPRDLLSQALTQLTLDGPPAAADSVLAEAILKKPGWARAYELRAVAALRGRACDVAAEQFLTLLEFGIERADGPELMRRCRRGG